MRFTPALKDGVAPALSRWAPAAPASTAPQAVAAGPPRAADAPVPAVQATVGRRHLQVVREPPGQPFDEAASAAAGAATGYLVPMGAGTERAGAAALEGWLREHGFAPADVPWPLRFATAGGLLLVWSNTGEPPARAGAPRPRAWRMGQLAQPAPEDLVRSLGGETFTAPTMPAVLAWLQRGQSATPTEKIDARA